MIIVQYIVRREKINTRSFDSIVLSRAVRDLLTKDGYIICERCNERTAYGNTTLAHWLEVSW